MSDEEIANIDRRQSIDIEPLGLFIGSFGLTYSFQVADRIALKPGISAFYLGAGFANNSAYLFQIGPSFATRFFLSDTAFNSGWYAEPGVTVSYVKSGTTSNWAFGAYAVAGYAWYWASGFTLSLGGGLAYNYYPNLLNTGFWLSYPHPTIDFSLGYSW